MGSGSENTSVIMVTCQVSESSLHLHLTFDSAIAREESATRLLQQLEHILGQIDSVPGFTEAGDLNRGSGQGLSYI